MTFIFMNEKGEPEMYPAPKEIMFHKGERYECKRTLNVNGKEYFTQNEFYNSPETNCLTDNNGEHLFITPNYLPYFYV